MPMVLVRWKGRHTVHTQMRKSILIVGREAFECPRLVEEDFQGGAKRAGGECARWETLLLGCQINYLQAPRNRGLVQRRRRYKRE